MSRYVEEIEREKRREEELRKTVSFKTGYQRGEFLVKVGIVPEKYTSIEDNSKTR